MGRQNTQVYPAVDTFQAGPALPMAKWLFPLTVSPGRTWGTGTPLVSHLTSAVKRRGGHVMQWSVVIHTVPPHSSPLCGIMSGHLLPLLFDVYVAKTTTTPPSLGQLHLCQINEVWVHGVLSCPALESCFSKEFCYPFVGSDPVLFSPWCAQAIRTTWSQHQSDCIMCEFPHRDSCGPFWIPGKAGVLLPWLNGPL